MKVKLIDYTGKGMHERYAAELLIFTKNTRLEMKASGLDDLSLLTDETVEKELGYMSNTIPSSWEFVDYTFMIEGCDRGFTHQLVRTRTGKYAQQSMRVIDMNGFDYTTGPTIEDDPDLESIYDFEMNYIDGTYKRLIESGASIEDARGVLPTNIKTNIAAKFDLRTIATMIAKRSSPRTQGMYRDFIEQMRSEILRVHPWAHVFLRNRKIEAAAKLDNFFESYFNECKEEYAGEKTDMIKLVDILRGE